ncbi:hypothetical protein BC830DRAFT_1084395 [Chytriomyces sp. MP71]|nr:hypothetical protein BC830DRAFT_1084395 [Chytriomyces sp. MP71]
MQAPPERYLSVIAALVSRNGRCGDPEMMAQTSSSSTSAESSLRIPDETSPLLGEGASSVQLSGSSWSSTLVSRVLLVALALITAIYAAETLDPLPPPSPNVFSLGVIPRHVSIQVSGRGHARVNALRFNDSNRYANGHNHAHTSLHFTLSTSDAATRRNTFVGLELEPGQRVTISVQFPNTRWWNWPSIVGQAPVAELFLMLPNHVHSVNMTGDTASLVWQGPNINDSLAFNVNAGSLTIVTTLNTTSVSASTQQGQLQGVHLDLVINSLELSASTGIIAFTAMGYTRFASSSAVLWAYLTPSTSNTSVTNVTTVGDPSVPLIDRVMDVVVYGYHGFVHAESQNHHYQISGEGLVLERTDPMEGWMLDPGKVSKNIMWVASRRGDLILRFQN